MFERGALIMNGSIRKNKYILLYVILTLVLLLIFIISFAVGRYNQINICDIPKILFNYALGGELKKHGRLKNKLI